MKEYTFKDASEAEFLVDAIQEGYYLFTFTCQSESSDAWHDIVVTGESGEQIRYKVGFSMAMPKTDYYLYLFKGENTVTLKQGYGNTYFYKFSYSDTPISIPSKIVPTCDVFYKDSPKIIKIHLIHYDHHPIKISDSEIIIPFTCTETEIEELVQGDALIRSDIFVSPDILNSLCDGTHHFIIVMNDGQELSYVLTVMQELKSAPLEILNFNIDHGNATLLTFPNGKHMLIDSAKEYYAETVIIPYLIRNNIKVDFYLLTHFHDDHIGKLDVILEQNEIYKPILEKIDGMLTQDKLIRYPYLSQFGYLDSRMVLPFDRLDEIWDLGGVNITVLNSRYDQFGYPSIDLSDENNSSVSMCVEYNGFKYHHAADNYANVEDRIMSLWEKHGEKDFLKCDFFNANHHFHGSVNDAFIRFINPVAVFVSAQGAVYARAAYTTIYKNEVENKPFENKRLKNTLLSCEVGNTVVKVWNRDEWYYEFYDNLTDCK